MLASRADAPATVEAAQERLEQIVAEVKSKDTPLDRSLDLLDEALRLADRTVQLVDAREPDTPAGSED